MMCRLVLALGFLLVGWGAAAGFAQEGFADTAARVTEGTVASVDWVGDKLLVDGPDGQVALIVPDDVKVEKGTEEASQEDIEQGAHVQVAYVANADGVFVATHILITDPL